MPNSTNPQSGIAALKLELIRRGVKAEDDTIILDISIWPDRAQPFNPPKSFQVTIRELINLTQDIYNIEPPPSPIPDPTPNPPPKPVPIPILYGEISNTNIAIIRMGLTPAGTPLGSIVRGAQIKYIDDQPSLDRVRLLAVIEDGIEYPIDKIKVGQFRDLQLYDPVSPETICSIARIYVKKA